MIKESFPGLYKYYKQQKLFRRVNKVLVRNSESFLYTTGWLRSLAEGKPLDETGNHIPWMNYPIVNLLRERLQSSFLLFEFGSGYSTLFYSRYVKKVISVESDKYWYECVKNTLPGNAEIVFVNNDVDGDYCRASSRSGDRWDVIVVDGRDRVNCIKRSISTLSERGVVLLDDSQRSRYQEGIIFARSRGFRDLSIESFKATGITIDRTTILYRQDNCMGI